MRSSDPDKIINHMTDSLERHLNDVFEEINTLAKQGTPVRTGRAQRGWRVNNYSLGRTATVIDNRVPYIGILDKGSSRQAPRGIVEPAIEQLRRRTNKL